MPVKNNLANIKATLVSLKEQHIVATNQAKDAQDKQRRIAEFVVKSGLLFHGIDRARYDDEGLLIKQKQYNPCDLFAETTPQFDEISLLREAVAGKSTAASQLKKRLSEAEKRIDELNAQYSNTIEERELTTSEKARVSKKLSQVQEEYEELSSEFEECRKSLEDEQDKCNELEMANGTLLKQVNHTESELEVSIESNEALGVKLAFLAEDVETKTTEIKALEDEKETLLKSQKQDVELMDKLNKKISSLNSEVEKTEVALHDKSEAFNETSQKMANMEEELNAERSFRFIEVAKVEGLTKEKADMLRRIEELETELESTKESLSDETQAKQKAQSEVKQLKFDVAACGVTANSAKTTIQALKNKLVMEEGNKGKLEAEVEKLKDQVAHLNKQKAQLTDEVKADKELFGTAKSEIEDLASKMEKSKAEYMHDLEVVLTKNKKFQAAIDSLRRENESLKREIFISAQENVPAENSHFFGFLESPCSKGLTTVNDTTVKPQKQFGFDPLSNVHGEKKNKESATVKGEHFLESFKAYKHSKRAVFKTTLGED